eukprot:3549924-Heterocapsa_arctica.AAC.1
MSSTGIVSRAWNCTCPSAPTTPGISAGITTGPPPCPSPRPYCRSIKASRSWRCTMWSKGKP